MFSNLDVFNYYSKNAKITLQKYYIMKLIHCESGPITAEGLQKILQDRDFLTLQSGEVIATRRGVKLLKSQDLFVDLTTSDVLNSCYFFSYQEEGMEEVICLDSFKELLEFLEMQELYQEEKIPDFEVVVKPQEEEEEE